MKIYTDGSCLENPGPGGWAFVTSSLKEKGKMEVKDGYEFKTTNNRMELLAALNALLFVKVFFENNEVDCRKENIEIISDSAYVVNAMKNKWLESWKENDWKTVKGKDVKNKDLWMAIDKVVRELNCKKEIVVFVKVKGHSGNPMNELVDKLARRQATIASELANCM